MELENNADQASEQQVPDQANEPTTDAVAAEEATVETLPAPSEDVVRILSSCRTNVLKEYISKSCKDVRTSGKKDTLINNILGSLVGLLPTDLPKYVLTEYLDQNKIKYAASHGKGKLLPVILRHFESLNQPQVPEPLAEAELDESSQKKRKVEDAEMTEGGQNAPQARKAAISLISDVDIVVVKAESTNAAGERFSYDVEVNLHHVASVEHHATYDKVYFSCGSRSLTVPL